jgi:hypothetical protein
MRTVWIRLALAMAMTLAGLASSAFGQDKLAYEVPSGWIQRDAPSGLTSLTPPGLPPGRLCGVSIFLPDPFSGTAEAYHNEIVKRATLNARLLEPPRHNTAGEFLVSALHQMTPAGFPLWVTVYTARWSDRGQAILFSANAEDLMRTYAPVVEAMMRRIVVPQAASGGAQVPAIAANGATASAEPQRLPTLTIDPPQDFGHSPGSDSNLQWYDSVITNATLRIYAFRSFAGDATRTFRETLFREWTSLDPVDTLAGPPVFDRASISGADTVLTARFLDGDGRSHLRLAVVANGGRAVAIVHLKAESPEGFEQVVPSLRKVLNTMRVTTGPARLSSGSAGADTRAVAGLYMVPRLKLTPLSATGSVASTYYYLFSSDGRVYRGYGLPKAPDGDIKRFDYAAAAQEDPENAGSFEVRGGQLVIQMGWQYPYTITVKVPDSQGKITIENSTFTRQLR